MLAAAGVGVGPSNRASNPPSRSNADGVALAAVADDDPNPLLPPIGASAPSEPNPPPPKPADPGLPPAALRVSRACAGRSSSSSSEKPPGPVGIDRPEPPSGAREPREPTHNKQHIKHNTNQHACIATLLLAAACALYVLCSLSDIDPPFSMPTEERRERERECVVRETPHGQRKECTDERHRIIGFPTRCVGLAQAHETN